MAINERYDTQPIGQWYEQMCLNFANNNLRVSRVQIFFEKLTQIGYMFSTSELFKSIVLVVKYSNLLP